MSSPSDYRRQLSQLEKDLGAVLSPRAVAEAFVRESGRAVIQAVIASAKAGIGPGNHAYPGHSVSRGRTSATPRRGGKPFLTLTGAMLDPANFAWRVQANGPLVLAWTAPSPEVGLYAEVHNSGLPIGRGGPRKKREFMHFDTTLTMAAVVRGLEAAQRRLAEELARKWRGS